ncbi:MAG: TetR family transcriptional regulator [Acidipropionibacterium sp.]|jgi:AcrR family transcriptional regulator|nr:TetR family transcriptional regulator [Acidipropionibacterium sp.]
MSRGTAADRRQDLIDAALRVIAREGVGGATTRAITREAGVSLGYFHYVFTSRDELITAVIDEVTDTDRFQGEEGGLAGRSAETDPAGVIEAGLNAYLDLLMASPHREQAMLELTLSALRMPDGQQQAKRQYEVYHRSAAEVLDAIARACGRSWATPVEDLAELLVVMTDGLTTTWLATRDSAAARRGARICAEAVTAHLEPDPVSTGPASLSHRR